MLSGEQRVTICSEGSERGGGGSHGKGLHGTRTHNGERGGKKNTWPVSESQVA